MSVRELAWLFVPVGAFNVGWGSFLLFAGWAPEGAAFLFSGLAMLLTYGVCWYAAVRGEVSRG